MSRAMDRNAQMQRLADLSDELRRWAAEHLAEGLDLAVPAALVQIAAEVRLRDVGPQATVSWLRLYASSLERWHGDGGKPGALN